VVFLLVAALTSVPLRAQTAVGTAFTYQGRLSDAGVPADGAYDLQFKLFAAETAGSQVGSTLTQTDVAVSGGLFTVSLDFGAVFGPDARWLEIGVRPGGSAGAFTTLSPRQRIQPTPSAAYAASAGVAVNEADPQVGATTSGNWCVGNGTQVSCTAAAPVASESDPQVGATTHNNWCRGSGTAVDCNRPVPSNCAANQYQRGDGCFDVGPHRFSGSLAPGASVVLGVGVNSRGEIVSLTFGDAPTQANYTLFTGMANDGNTAIKGFTFETGRATVLNLRLVTTDTTADQYVAAHGYGKLRGGGLWGHVTLVNNHPTSNLFYVALFGPSSDLGW
jgi:hypothetical protein